MGKVQINVQVDEEQKADWETHVEDSGRFGSLSDLIRASVESEINDDREDEESVSPGLESDVQKITEDLARVRKDVQWLRQQEQDETDISELAQDVFDILEPLPEPTGPVEIPDDVEDEQAYRRQSAAIPVVEPESNGDDRFPQTLSAIADRVGSTEPEVRDALDHLQDQFLPVVEVEIEGETHYFKEAS